MTDKELQKEFEKSYLGENPLSKKYIYDVLFVGMAEEEFVSKFTHDSSYEGTARPYILKKKGNAYYITFPNLDYTRGFLIQRATFKEKRLVKFEYRYIDKFPFMFYVYHDDTDYLTWRGQDIPMTRFAGMSESEFLDKVSSGDFFHIISRQANKKGNKYIIQGQNGKKWRLSFYPNNGGIFSSGSL